MEPLSEKDVQRFIIDDNNKHIKIALRSTPKSLKFAEDLEETFFVPGTRENDDFKLISGMGEFLVIIPNDAKNRNRVECLAEKHGLKFKNTKKSTARRPISTPLRHEALKRDNYKCKECGATKEIAQLEVDHIIPVSQGGTDELQNLQTLCLICNRSKTNRSWTAGA